MVSLRVLQNEALESLLAEAAQVLRERGVIAMPTESFYALGACPLDDTAVRRVCTMKGRPEGKPIPVLIPDRAHLTAFASDLTPGATVLMDRFWPGPLTIVFPALSGLPRRLTAGTGTVGVRCPAYPMLLTLLRHVGPVTGTSANRSGAAPACTASEVMAAFGAQLDLILDGGPAPGGPPSTVVTTVGRLRLLREGQIPQHQIEAVLAESGMSLVQRSLDGLGSS